MLRFWFKTSQEQKRSAGEVLRVDVSRYNYGICGHTKMGKSTLVNVLIGKDLAATGHSETTDRSSKYDTTIISNATLWDLAGCGTARHNSDSYFWSELLYAFDMLIIISQDTITPEEMKLAAESLKRKQPVIFVRSKCDQALESDKLLKNKEANQDSADKFVEEMLIKFENEIKDAKMDNVNLVKVFFISSVMLQQHLKGETPRYWFQEKEFLRELKQAAACTRGKSNIFSVKKCFSMKELLKSYIPDYSSSSEALLIMGLTTFVCGYFGCHWYSSRNKRRLGIQDERFNIAFVGRASTGRTTLIEAIFGNDGIVGESDCGVKYESLHFPNITAWEMPKYITKNSNQRFNIEHLSFFDLIIVVSQATLGTDEIYLLSEAQKRNKPVIMVRSRCDFDLQSPIAFGKIHGINQEAANILMSKLKEAFNNDLTSVNLSNIPVFFVSAVYLQNLVTKIPQHVYFQEKEFMKYIIDAAKKNFSTDNILLIN